MLTRRILLTALAVLAVVAAAAMLFRFQPSDTATIYRSGSRVIARTTPLYVRVIGASRCHVPMVGDRFAFEGDAPGDGFSVHVRFTYSLPPLLPGHWPPGNWCTSLAQHILVPSVPLTDLLDHRRRASDRIASAIDQELRSDGILATNVSARIDVPPGFERLHPVADVMKRARRERPVIFIGLDGADWSLLDGYMASGAMPNLKKLVDQGTRGNLQTEVPALSPLVWTTMMTGVGPLQHQILDFARFDPVTHEKEPITSDERRAPAIWNEETYAGKTCAQFGLWATYAAEPLRGINVSDRLFTFLYSNPGPGVVYPPDKQPWAEKISRDVEKAITLQRVREFIPNATEAEFAVRDNPYANPVSALRRILIDTEVYRRLSLGFLESHPLPDLTIVYFEGTDSIGHEFAPYAPPKQPQISQADYDRYSGVPEKYFRYIDTILGDYMKVNAVIVIASDHGFRWTEGRPAEVSSTATATAAKWHAPQGIIAVSEHHAVPKEIRGVCEFLRKLTGLPDLDYAKYFLRAMPPPAQTNAKANQEALAKLRALGYIGAGEASKPATPQNDTKTAGAYNNAGLILRDEHRIDEAIASFDHALSIDPHYASAMWNLSETLFNARRDLDRSDALLVSALQFGLADADKFVIARSIAYKDEKQEDRSLNLLQQAVALQPQNPDLLMFRGRYLLDLKQCPAALQDFLAVEQAQPANALAFASAGLAQMCAGDKAGAKASFDRAKQIDPTLQVPR